jgi:hypothetical protein
MALLNVCTITGGNMVIQVALMFIRQEREEDYTWALGYLRDIMSRQLSCDLKLSPVSTDD